MSSSDLDFLDDLENLLGDKTVEDEIEEIEEVEAVEAVKPVAKPVPKTTAPKAAPAPKQAAIKPAKTLQPSKASTPKKKAPAAELEEHGLMNRELFIRNFKEYLSTFEFHPTSNKDPVIEAGALAAIFETNKQAEGLIVAVESFFKETISNHSLRFGGLYIKHKFNNQRDYSVPSLNTKQTEAAHVKVIASVSLDELRGGNKYLFDYTLDKNGNLIYSDPNAEKILKQKQVEIDELKLKAKNKMDRNLKK